MRPLTTVALASVGEQMAGLAGGVNNAAARLAGPFGTVVIPLAAGPGGSSALRGVALEHAFSRAMIISAGLCASAALVAAATIEPRRAAGGV